MQIEKKQHRSTAPAQAATSRNAQVARDHAALFPARLALARWTRGGDIPHVFASGNRPLRATWYAQTQRGFQSWLEAGGFHQATPRPSRIQETCAACRELRDEGDPGGHAAPNGTK